MPVKLTTRFEPVVPPGAALTKKTQEFQKAGKKVYSLTGGDPTRYGFHPPAFVQEALKKALDDNYHMYPLGSGIEPKLQEAIAAREKKVTGVDYTADDIVLSPGTTLGQTLLYEALLDTDDNIVSTEPTYQQYFFYTKYFRARMATIQCSEDNGWQPVVDELRKVIDDRTKFILVNNPNNPTGAVYSEKALKQICDIAGEFDIPVVSDEIYDMCLFDDAKFTSIAKVSGDVPVVVTNGMAKSFMTTGWRIGYLAYHDPKGRIQHLKASTRVLKSLIGNIATPISVAALAAYQNWDKGMENFQRMRDSLQKSKDLTMRRFKEMPGISTAEPGGAMYAFPRVEWVGKVWKDDAEFMMQLLEEQQVVFVPGSNYGPISGFAHFRALLLPTPPELDVIYDRMEKFMVAHRPS